MLFGSDKNTKDKRKCYNCSYAELNFNLYFCEKTKLLKSAEETCDYWCEKISFEFKLFSDSEPEDN